jgi:integrase
LVLLSLLYQLMRALLGALKAPRVEEEEIEPLTVEEAKLLLLAAAHRRNGTRWAVALAVGLRQGEALGLQWPRVDLTTGTMRVREALQRRTWQHGCSDPHTCGERYHKVTPCKTDCRRHKRACPPPCPPDCTAHARWCPLRQDGGLVLDDVKSRAGRRTIALPPRLFTLLTEHHATQQREREAADDLWEEHGFVFTGPTGRPIDPRADNREWAELLKEAGVREARLHDARHTAATVLLVLGINQRAVMGLMGWSNNTMTTRYQHLTPDLRRDIAEQVDGLLWESR